ncbi:ABC transporter substrate-binding protein [Megalodesulfovibrio paquesii]
MSMVSTAAAAPLTVQLKWRHQFQFAGYYAALAQGYYRDAGLQVELKEWTGPQSPVEEVLAGRADVAVGAADILQARLQGQPVVLLASIFQRSPLALLALKPSGIATPQDLAGRRLSITRHSDLELWAMLRLAGVREQDVVIADDPPNRVRDLLAGTVDAISGYLSTQAPQLQERGMDPVVLRPSTYDIEFYGDSLFTSKAVLQARREEVEHFVRATLKGWEYALAHPDRTVDLILEHYTPEADRAALLREAEAVRRLIAPERAPVGASELVRWRAMAEELLALGYAGDIALVDGFIHTPGELRTQESWRFLAVVVGIALLAMTCVAALLVINRHMSREIRRRKAAEATARETGRLLESMLRQLPVLLFRVNAAQEILFCRGQGLRRLGVEDDALVGRRLDLVFPDIARRLQDARGGEPISFEVQGVTKDSPWQLETYAFQDDDGCRTAFALDTTAMLQAEQVRARLLALIESTPDIVSMADAAGKVMYLNTAGRAFFEMGEPEGSRLLIPMFHPLDANRRILNDAIPTAIREGMWMGETVLRNLQGQELPVSQAIIAHKDPDGTVRHLSTICRDLSRRMEMEAELKAATRAAQAASQVKSEFLDHMSHEIRTPLNGLLGMLQLLSLTELTEEQREYVDTGLTSGRGLVTILTDILDLSRVESGRLSLEERPMQLRALVDEVAWLFRAEAQEKGLAFRVWVDPAAPDTIMADASRLRQVLFNLLGNAVKFTDAGEIMLEVVAVAPGTPGPLQAEQHGSGALVFQITDTGPGIAQQDIPRLFEAFVQQPIGSGAHRRRKKGLGLGLAVVARLVKLMGGTVLVASVPGEGSEFTVTIPCTVPETDTFLRDQNTQNKQGGQADPIVPPTAPEPAGKADNAEDSAAGPQSESQAKPQAKSQPVPQDPRVDTLRILVAEDEPTNRFTMETFLSRRGHRVSMVADGEKALHAALGEPFDLILLDIQLPVLSGLDVARRLREQGIRTPIVAITAFAMQGDRERFLEAGMTDYLSKPLDFKALETLLQQCAAL